MNSSTNQDKDKNQDDFFANSNILSTSNQNEKLRQDKAKKEEERRNSIKQRALDSLKKKKLHLLKPQNSHPYH